MRAIFSLCAGFFCLAAPLSQAQITAPNDKQIVIAHRGASAYAPEHTFFAYDLAVQMGTDMLECDLLLTKDEVPVCIHDTTVDRTASGTGTGAVDSFTLAELRGMDFGTWFNTQNPTFAKPEYAGAKIVPFEEELDCYLRHNPRMRFHVETKDSAGGRAEQIMVDLLTRKGLLATGDIAAGSKRNYAHSTVLLQSFDAGSLQRMRGLTPFIPTGFLFAAPNQTTTPWLINGTGPSYIDAYIPNSAVLLSDSSAVSRFHANGHDVHTWTVNDQANMKVLLAQGVDGLFTNNTDLLRAEIDAAGTGTTPTERGNPESFARGCPGIAGRVTSKDGPGDVWAATGTRGVQLVSTPDGSSSSSSSSSGGSSSGSTSSSSSGGSTSSSSGTGVITPAPVTTPGKSTPSAREGRFGGGSMPVGLLALAAAALAGRVRRSVIPVVMTAALAACGDSGGVGGRTAAGSSSGVAGGSSSSSVGGSSSSSGAGSSSSGSSSGSGGSSGAAVADRCGHARTALRETTFDTTLIPESSGLARSQRQPCLLWTFNDSGGNAEGFAVDTDGRYQGTLSLVGGNTGGTPITALNIDWEDMASFSLDGKPYLMFADIGDNNAFRPSLTLYVVEEPDVSALAKPFSLSTTPAWTLNVNYPDGPRDAESVAVDPVEGMVYILSKRDAQPTLYRTPLVPATGTGTPGASPALMEKLSAISIPRAPADHPNPESINWTTAMDFNQTQSEAIVLTLTRAYRYPRAPGETWVQAFTKAPQALDIPQYSQSEAITFAADGLSVLQSSENAPFPLAEIALP